MKIATYLGLVVALAGLIAVGAPTVQGQQEQTSGDQQQVTQSSDDSNQTARPRPPRGRAGDQAGQRGEGRGFREGRGGGGADRMARWREDMIARYQDTLEISDEEWKVVKPLLEKVVEKQFSQRMRMFRRGGGRGGPGGGGDQPAEVQALSDTLDKANATPEEIKAKMAALREARKKEEAETQKAREDLRKVCTVKQEAKLVLSGVLD